MDKKKINIGFIGAGYMGYGIAHNFLKNKIPLSVIAHKNRKPIDKLIAEGAIESNNLEELAKFANIIIMCVTNTNIAIQVVNEILPHLLYFRLFQHFPDQCIGKFIKFIYPFSKKI